MGLSEFSPDEVLVADEKSNYALVDLAVARPSFSARTVVAELGISTARPHELINTHLEIGILRTVGHAASGRRFFAPRVMEVLVAER